MTGTFSHRSVMLNEVLEWLAPRPDGVYADGTAGGGGHSHAIGERLSENGLLICNDRDEDALTVCRERMKDLKCGVKFLHGRFSDLAQNAGCRFDGVLLDLGVSSYQLDCAERGFSYAHDAPLDMRMDQTDRLTAKELLNEWQEAELSRIFFEYGEERYARRIVAEIIRRRTVKPLNTTGELADAVCAALPKCSPKDKLSSEKRIFQAVRLAVNDELDQVRTALDALADNLNDGGRIAVLTFHSLEDRIVKSAFARYEHPCTCPPGFPVCVCGKKPLGKVLVKGLAPSEAEISENSRAHSARLRVFERRLGEN